MPVRSVVVLRPSRPRVQVRAIGLTAGFAGDRAGDRRGTHDDGRVPCSGALSESVKLVRVVSRVNVEAARIWLVVGDLDGTSGEWEQEP
jgi:hypothetical protein